MGGLPSLNKVFRPVLNLASYISYCLAALLKTGLPRLGVFKGVQSRYEF